MLRKMGKPDTLRVLYPTVPYVRSVELSVVQMDSLGILFSELRLVAAGCRSQKELICGPYIKRSNTGLVPHNAPSVPFESFC